MKAMNIMNKILLTGLAVLSLGLALTPRVNAQVSHGTTIKSVATSTPLAVTRGGGGKDGQETHG